MPSNPVLVTASEVPEKCEPIPTWDALTEGTYRLIAEGSFVLIDRDGRIIPSQTPHPRPGSWLRN